MSLTPTEPGANTSTFSLHQKSIPASTADGKRMPLSSILPPLIFGTATFNHQFNTDPFALDTVGLVTSALTHGIRAFDTSPYYGPSEELLGNALATPFVRETFPRDSYMILTKVGRVVVDEFDYSAKWVRQSVLRSLERLHTEYLDVVYCHDIEFVSLAEVLEAVTELRALRDEGKIRYVGICGFPVDALGDAAEMLLRETGEPVDIVQSYAHFNLQNQTLGGPRGIERLQKVSVDVVTNASCLGMGLLRQQGVPVGGHGDWHPACRELRTAVREASDFCDRHDEKIEVIAIRWALESWIEKGAICGSQGDPASGLPWKHESNADVGSKKLGVNVIGVSQPAELDKTMLVWRSILDGLEGGEQTAVQAGRWSRAWEWSRNRKRAVQILAEGVEEVLGPWFGYSWDSPEKGFVNMRGKKDQNTVSEEQPSSLLTPAASPGSEGFDSPEKSIPLR